MADKIAFAILPTIPRPVVRRCASHNMAPPAKGAALGCRQRCRLVFTRIKKWLDARQ